jgi:hypothetical protein
MCCSSSRCVPMMMCRLILHLQICTLHMSSCRRRKIPGPHLAQEQPPSLGMRWVESLCTIQLSPAACLQSGHFATARGAGLPSGNPCRHDQCHLPVAITQQSAEGQIMPPEEPPHPLSKCLDSATAQQCCMFAVAHMVPLLAGWLSLWATLKCVRSLPLST